MYMKKNTNLNMLGEKITLVNNIRKHSYHVDEHIVL